MSSVFSAPHFHSEKSAFAYVEERLWPSGPVCPHCGGVNRIGRLEGKSTRVGLWKCYQCRKPFTVKIGTIFESSHVALHLWLQAIYLIAGSKKGISSNQLHRILGVTLKTAWFMAHRIREAMRDGDLSPMGGEGGIVEVDEAFIGQKAGAEKAYGFRHKIAVLGLIDRDSGRARSMVIDNLRPDTVVPVIQANVSAESHLMTDEATHYRRLHLHFASHGSVKHGAGEYTGHAKGRPMIHTNTIEGYFSIFKRGMRGIYQHCAERHLHRYLAEFDFRYSNRAALGYNDADRADALLSGIVGKRLTYQTIGAS